MYGYIHAALKGMILESHGEDFWKQILEHVGIEAGTEAIVNQHYDDQTTFGLVSSICVLTRIPREEVWEQYGRYFCIYVMENGWDELLRSLSPDLRASFVAKVYILTLAGFLNNMDSFHYFIDHVVYKANMKGPSFRCEEGDGNTIVLHYLSSRSGLYPIVKGLLRELAKRVYGLEIEITIQGRTQKVVQFSSGERMEEHVVFNIATKQEDGSVNSLRDLPIIQNDNTGEWQLHVNHDDFQHLMPYHFVVDRDCKLVQVGSRLVEHISEEMLQPGTPISRIFEIHRPQITLEFENICNFINGVFVLQSRSIPLLVQNQQQASQGHGSKNSQHSSDPVEPAMINAQHLKLKGQMILIDNDHLIYLCSPYVRTVSELDRFGLKLSSFPLHDSTRDLILLNQQRMSDVEDHLKLDQSTQEAEALAEELARKEQLLEALKHDILPGAVASQISQGKHVPARVFDMVTVMYVDVPTFQDLLSTYKPSQVINIIDDLFSRFDRLVHLHDIYNIAGIGETYFCVSGVPEPTLDHAETMIHVALGLEWKARAVMDSKKEESLRVRCGIHTGSVIAGVVGEKHMRYAVYGDCMNVAMRMPQDASGGRIIITEATRQAAETTGRFDLESRGMTQIADFEPMPTYYVKKSYKKSIWEIINRPRDENVNSIDGYAELEKILSGVDYGAVALHGKTTACSII
ncbi:unnamed protein product [Bursaphelenchus xylophilus]|uniref:guanylate cyclase n=1 Tax=Bursaphelenchus xylophilus TaxID=6326 RepID=A0A1I7RW94_BURXY|nr:unnamed protein product [Bursaphelenchus xylophilus]CAG9095312.1 unnamed protein product [Bursaphelenchus xylophilus]